jgi:iron complex outermembrane recepter protein
MSKNSEVMSARLMRGAGISSLAIALAWAAVPSLAHAQEAEEMEAEDAASRDIIVTGTLIRGTAPVGANTITVGEARIEETGAISSNELLASIPQVSNFFNNVPLAQINSLTTGRVQTNRPNIRGIGNTTIAVSPTLVLVNGHRIAGVGVANSNVDPDMIAVGAISRVDVVTEGGSATYGADAVAGVINFITHRRFDGVRVDGSYGFADDYSQWNGGVTAGRTWSTGSVYASYAYARTDPLYGRDRDFAQVLDYSSQPYLPADLTCSNPNLTLSTFLTPFNVRISDTPYAAPGFVENTANRCDNNENATLVPKSERHTVFAGLNQELGDRTTIDVRGFYGRRTTENRSEAEGQVALGAGNPAAGSLPAGLVVGPAGTIDIGLGFPVPIDRRALVNFSFAPVLGPSPLVQSALLEEWGADVELKHDITDDWQLQGLAAYSEGNSRFNAQSVSAERLAAAGQGTTPETAINPLDITQTNRALINDLIDNEVAGQAKSRLLQLRAIAEGRLLALPGGDVRLAVGAEYIDEKLSSRQGAEIRRGALNSADFNSIGRNLYSAFGELQVPIFGEENAFDGMRSLVISAAARYDHYSDFGGTFNPKIGVTYEPVKGFRIRGNWGTSFTAPSLVDLLGGLQLINTTQNVHPFQPSGTPPPPNSYTVVIQGTRLPLQPQEADTWSVGVDVEPARDLRFSLSYYEVKFKNIISIPTPSADIFTDFADTNFVSGTGLSADVVRGFASQVPGGLAQVEPLIDAGQTFYSLIDFRVGNYGILDIAGLDFSGNYRKDTGFGSFDLGFNGNLQLRRIEQVSPLGGARDRLEVDDSPELTFQLLGGVDIGTFRAQATWNHSASYRIIPTPSVPPQNRVGAFNTVNLFFKYDVPADSGLMQGLRFTVNVNNVLDEDPPQLRRNQPGDFGYANGFTLGRMFILGVSKKF